MTLVYTLQFFISSLEVLPRASKADQQALLSLRIKTCSLIKTPLHFALALSRSLVIWMLRQVKTRARLSERITSPLQPSTMLLVSGSHRPSCKVKRLKENYWNSLHLHQRPGLVIWKISNELHLLMPLLSDEFFYA